MALDTKYRPKRFDDVIGQEESVTVLREFVKSGSGFHQSYLFSGGHGSGKTTLGRILARALLCESPENGDPCDKCTSCRSILDYGTAEGFTEFDAATNSGKSDIKHITDFVQYDTFSGKRRIFLMDEAHRLSRDALDALLKPMEDTAPGSEDKLMVCIFCTTEPEKMRATIFSRCAPAFVIRKVTPERIADRLAYVCEEEGIPYERDALVLIGAAVESHIRDALKAVEGISMLGAVNKANTASYLRLNTHPYFVKILENIGKDLGVVLSTATELEELVSPATVYEKLAELAMLAFASANAGRKVPVYWDAEAVAGIARIHGPHLINIASLFASRPQRATYSMLACDLATTHFRRTGEIAVSAEAAALPLQVKVAPPPVVEAPAPIVTPISTAVTPTENREIVHEPVGSSGTVAEPPPAQPYTTKMGVYINPRGINRRTHEETDRSISRSALDPVEFRKHLMCLVAELNGDVNRRST
jgi:DNA polymerase III subunit gamma/tau